MQWENFKYNLFWETNKNKNDNIHKNKAQKRLDKRTLTLVECQN